MAAAAVEANKIRDANNQFTADIYKEIIKIEPGNILFSPLSAQAILALVYCGMEGGSAQELAKTLHLSGSKEEIRDHTNSLLSSVLGKGIATVQLANAAFVGGDFEVKEPFVNIAREYFFSDAANMDYTESQEAADTINEFVEHRTDKSIKNLVDPDSLSPATSLVLVNALRFKGNWSMFFSKPETDYEGFYSPQGIMKVHTLHIYRMYFSYCECKDLDAKFLELPFKGLKEASMVLVLPMTWKGLSKLEEHIDKIATFEIPFERTYLQNVAVPKFKFEYNIDFKNILRQLGVSKIFDHSQADLSGIAGDKGQVVVSEVLQKVYIDLNEGGVEAELPFCNRSWNNPMIGDYIKDFVANQPFIFLLKSQRTTVFAGRVVEPQY